MYISEDLNIYVSLYQYTYISVYLYTCICICICICIGRLPVATINWVSAGHLQSACKLQMGCLQNGCGGLGSTSKGQV